MVPGGRKERTELAVQGSDGETTCELVPLLNGEKKLPPELQDLYILQAVWV